MKELIKKLETGRAVFLGVYTITKANGTPNKKLANFLDLNFLDKTSKPYKAITLRVRNNELENTLNKLGIEEGEQWTNF